MSRNLYAEASARILVHLETGTIPWVKPWRATAGRNQPRNAVSQRPYSGCNVLMLWLAQRDYPTPAYLTFKQALDFGGNVRKGEHGTAVYFVKQMLGKPKAGDDNASEGGQRSFTILKSYTVFNTAQCEGLPDKITNPTPPKPRHDDARDVHADEFIAATGCDFRENGCDRAYYNVAGDFVAVPRFDSFNSADAFYSTSFHELGHWTGSPKRLARDLKNKFGSPEYGYEELIAELTAAFLCAEFDINGQDRHSAAYIKGWIKLLKDEPRAFMSACAAAQRAADHLRGLALADDSKIAA